MNKNEYEETKLRFFRLANGIMAISYFAFAAWVAAQLFNMLT